MTERVKTKLSSEYRDYKESVIDIAEYLYHLNQVSRAIRKAWITDLITNDEYEASMLVVVEYMDKL